MHDGGATLSITWMLFMAVFALRQLRFWAKERPLYISVGAWLLYCALVYLRTVPPEKPPARPPGAAERVTSRGRTYERAGVCCNWGKFGKPIRPSGAILAAVRRRETPAGGQSSEEDTRRG